MSVNCSIQYFTQSQNLGARLLYMPVIGSPAAGYHFESFLPFVIIAVASLTGSAPNGSPGDAVLTFNAISPDQDTFPHQLLAQSMMQSNRDGANSSGFMTYTPNANGIDFTNYYRRNMQEPGLQDQNFGAFLMPAFLIESFWDDISAFALLPSYDNMITSRVNDIVNRIFTETDLKLWYPNGKYTMVGTNAPGPNTDSYFPNFSGVIGTSTGQTGLIIVQLKSIE